MGDGILVVNAGSSSVKFALYVLAGGEPVLRYKGLADGIGAQPRLVVKGTDGERLLEQGLEAGADQGRALQLILEWLDDHLDGVTLKVAGHRIVHGGPKYSAPLRLDEALLAELEALSPLAPLHQPHNLKAVRAVLALRPRLPQVACFDTAFHRGQPRLAQLFALPRRYAEQGVLRYGFHGLSYEYIAQRLPRLDPVAAQGRTVVAHLGNGASMCALQGGRSVATTMGFTAVDGLMMGQRTGSLDPGVVLYLQRQEGMTPDAIEDLLYRRSGLLGVSGISADMRQLLASDAAEAEEAIELYCYRAAREVGSLAVALGGLDALVFTAGVGENAPSIRARICSRLKWMGVELDADANARQGPEISRPGARVRVWVVPTDEESTIARHAWGLAKG